MYAHGVHSLQMSFLSDTVLPGSTRLYIERGGVAVGREGRRTLRKSQSHAGLLSPLVQLIRDPVRTIGGVPHTVDDAVKQSPAHPKADRQQLLYLRMRNVSVKVLSLLICSHNAFHRPSPTTNGKPRQQNWTLWKETIYGKPKMSL